jgi:hypothetical protein
MFLRNPSLQGFEAFSIPIQRRPDEIFGLVARAGNQAPGAPDGALFDRFNTIDMLASGQLIFGASLRGTGVTTENSNGIWVQNPMGELLKLVRQGDVIEVGSGDFRTVAFFNFAFGQSVNELGDIAIEMRFADNTSGVFVTRVPEPASALLIAAASLVYRRRRWRGSSADRI